MVTFLSNIRVHLTHYISHNTPAYSKTGDKSQPSAEQGGDKMAIGNLHAWTGVYSDNVRAHLLFSGSTWCHIFLYFLIM